MPGPPRASSLPRTLVLVLLAVICGAIALGRLHTYDEPLDRDVATYVVIGGEMLHGRALYTDLWDNKPPALYAAFAAAQLVARDPTAAVFLVGLACAWTTAIALFAAGAGGRRVPDRAVDRRLLGLSSPRTSRCRPISRTPRPSSMRCLAIAFAALVRSGPRPFDSGAVAAGLGLGAAILLKVITAPLALAWSVLHVIAPPAGTARSRAAVQASVFLAMSALGWGGRGRLLCRHRPLGGPLGHARGAQPLLRRPAAPEPARGAAAVAALSPSCAT